MANARSSSGRLRIDRLAHRVVAQLVHELGRRSKQPGGSAVFDQGMRVNRQAIKTLACLKILGIAAERAIPHHAWPGRSVAVDIALHLERPFFTVLAPSERLGQ